MCIVHIQTEKHDLYHVYYTAPTHTYERKIMNIMFVLSLKDADRHVWVEYLFDMCTRFSGGRLV